MQRPSLKPYPCVVPVSILIRPKGRMQPLLATTSAGPPYCFNPHPAQGPDATRAPSSMRVGIGCFNPHPALGPDATLHAEGVGDGFSVSILIRPKGRMQPHSTPCYRSSILFQSSSGPRAGCNSLASAYQLSLYPFQSSSGPRAGCNKCGISPPTYP